MTSFLIFTPTPVLEAKDPFHINACEFSLYWYKEKLTHTLADLVAAFDVFEIKHPRRLS